MWTIPPLWSGVETQILCIFEPFSIFLKIFNEKAFKKFINNMSSLTLVMQTKP